MTNLVKGADIRTIKYGIRVQRTAAVLPTVGTGHIFQVKGGKISVVGIVGECTTACDGTVTTLKITSTPTVGTAVDITSAVAVTSKELGSLIGLASTLGGALSVTNAGAGQIPSGFDFVVPIGFIDLITSATNVGAFKWSLLYVPLDDGASVVAV